VTPLSQEIRKGVDRVAFAESIGIIPDAWQAQLLRSTSDRVILNCCRQSGKSTMSAVIALHRAIYDEGSLSLILAPAERQAKETLVKLLSLYRGLGHTVPSDSSRKLGLKLANGSRIEALPGSEKTIRGFSAVGLLILDEASRIEDALYHAVRPMLSVSAGSLLMASSPNGRRGVFFEEWTEGIGWERYMITAAQVPRISEAFLEEERQSLPRNIFRQEYEAEFVETEDAVFALEDIERAFDTDLPPLFAGASLADSEAEVS
jgi:hypothetical protein